MILVSFGVIAQGIYESGGVEKAYTINKDHGMFHFENFHFEYFQISSKLFSFIFYLLRSSEFLPILW